jgi:hypothetical protein
MPVCNSERSRKYRQRLKERVREIHGTVCKTCGADPAKDETVRLQLAHVKPTGLRGAGRGLDRRMLDAIKNKDCYRLECSGCHYQRDRYGLAAVEPNFAYPASWDEVEDF